MTCKYCKYECKITEDSLGIFKRVLDSKKNWMSIHFLWAPEILAHLSDYMKLPMLEGESPFDYKCRLRGKYLRGAE